jgi:hypothetical protein
MTRFSIADRDTPILRVIRDTMPFLDLETGPWVAGGVARLIFEGIDQLGHSDIDVFFPSADHYKWAADMIHRQARGRYTRNPMTFDTSFSAPTCKLIPVDQQDDPGFTIQLINRIFHPTVDALLDGFDFSVTRFATDGYDIITMDDARPGQRILHTEQKRGTIGRLAKYCAKGFFPEPGILSATLAPRESITISDTLREIDSGAKDTSYRDDLP